MSLQVICNAQIIASSDFTYYEDANSLLQVRPPSPLYTLAPSPPRPLPLSPPRQVKEKEEEEADEGLSPETESHGASSAVPEVRVEKVEDDEPPLSHYRPQVGGFSSFRSQRKMLITTHSDADSAVSMVCSHWRLGMRQTATPALLYLGLSRIISPPSLPPSSPLTAMRWN